MKSRSQTSHGMYGSLLRGALLASAITCPSYVFAQAARTVEANPAVSEEGTTLNIGLDLGGGYNHCAMTLCGVAVKVVVFSTKQISPAAS